MKFLLFCPNSRIIIFVSQPTLLVEFKHEVKTIRSIFHRKLKNAAIVAAALALPVGMTACGSSASSTAASSVASSAAASSEAASSEAEAVSAEYTVYNTTGSTVTELYLYDAGSEEKGDNLAGENGLADGESIVITRDEDADKQSDVNYVLEFTTEDGETQSFETLHYETTPISLKNVDAAAGATPIAFAAPEK